DPVRKYSEMLGVDPLHLASEGVAVLAVDRDVAEEVLEFVRNLGFYDAAIIGEVQKDEKFQGLVIIRSEIGGLRVLEPPTGEIVPRIC
ncbi:MAG: AIR synthase-related protein, partial [Candidatus Bathyarchaeia archaeon]